jgi:F420-non-reducing hydrogenase iron-sulfur subunit
MDNKKPSIIAFVCNWCSYAGADKTGGERLAYPPNVKLVRVMCSGRVDPHMVMHAFRQGADGVMVLGCHPGDCHYRSGNMKALRRFSIFQRMIAQFGIEPGRFMLDWVSAGEGKKFQELTTAFTAAVEKLGPLQLKGMVESGVRA